MLILRGEDSDLLHASTVREMQKRGAAAKKNLVRAVEVRGCGHAPALMTDHQISLIEEFLEDDKRTQSRNAPEADPHQDEDHESRT